MSTHTPKNKNDDGLPACFHAAIAQSKVMNMGYVEEAARLVHKIAPAHQAVLRANLELLAQMPGTVDGVDHALTQLDAMEDTFPNDPNARSSGRAPGSAAMHYAAMCMINGLVAQAARGSDDAVPLLRIVRQHSVIDDDDRRQLSQEVQIAVGRPAYMAALEQVG